MWWGLKISPQGTTCYRLNFDSLVSNADDMFEMHMLVVFMVFSFDYCSGSTELGFPQTRGVTAHSLKVFEFWLETSKPENVLQYPRKLKAYQYWWKHGNTMSFGHEWHEDRDISLLLLHIYLHIRVIPSDCQMDIIKGL